MYYSIQACRAVAALFVTCFHLGGSVANEKYFGIVAAPFERIFYFGGSAGVTFFFVLSGFLITNAHHQDFGVPSQLWTYIRKRTIRIYTPYIIIFISVYLLAFITPSLRNNLPHDVEVIIKSILLIPQDKTIVGGTGAPVIIVAWSLQYEMMFYCTVGLAIVNRWLFLISGMAFILNFIHQNLITNSLFPQSFFANKLFFLFGMGILVSISTRSKLQLKKPLFLSFVAISVFLCLCIAQNATYQQPHFTNFFEILYGIVSSILLFSLVRVEDSQPQYFKNSLLSLLGNSSYALYLIHFPLISFLAKIMVTRFHGFWGVFISFFIMLITCIIVSISFHLYIEMPLLKKIRPEKKVFS
jgi:exopolysaccharide production protein ExoZ